MKVACLCAILFADMAQQVEHVLGKDEVPGSNPGISSMKRANQTICAFFSYKISQYVRSDRRYF